MRSKKQTERQLLLMESPSPTLEGRNKRQKTRGKEGNSINSEREEKTEGDKTLGNLGVVKPVTPGEDVPLRGAELCDNMDEPSTSKHFLVYCCNPIKKPGHDYHKKNLRIVNENLLRHNANLHVGDKLCDGCRKATIKLPVILTPQEGWYSDSSKSQDDLNVPEVPLTPEKIEAIEALNKSLTAIEETPIKRKCLTEKQYPETKIKKAMEAF
ncbi:hypothetical protein AVEN_56151-1 [Araneus ventricosus]|uniref:Uncharacterized protein n=1 Tax=Araneus ventricosus TaxID=182803 RepID=A0A4Y2MHU2_ARAVE|nr:hypothetical protein AVEN_56151-1 [Araneus ventricosus]